MGHSLPKGRLMVVRPDARRRGKQDGDNVENKELTAGRYKRTLDIEARVKSQILGGSK
jgi:hypothetical protein